MVDYVTDGADFDAMFVAKVSSTRRRFFTTPSGKSYNFLLTLCTCRQLSCGRMWTSLVPLRMDLSADQ